MDTTISLIRDEIDYATALIAYESYFNNQPATGSEDGDRFEMPSPLVGEGGLAERGRMRR